MMHVGRRQITCPAVVPKNSYPGGLLNRGHQLTRTGRSTAIALSKQKLEFLQKSVQWSSGGQISGTKTGEVAFPSRDSRSGPDQVDGTWLCTTIHHLPERFGVNRSGTAPPGEFPFCMGE